MIPVELQTPGEMARNLADRVRARRLERKWTQAETAERAGIALPTYRVFERTGRISLLRFLNLTLILDAAQGVDGLFQPPRAASIAEMAERNAGRPRRRGRRKEKG